MVTYAIDDKNSNQLTCGLQGYEQSKTVAQRMADERGESVWLYEECVGAEANEANEAGEIRPKIYSTDSFGAPGWDYI